MDGVMMRNGDHYGLAVRAPDGSILAERRPWISLGRFRLLRLPFVRGFPILLESLANGIKALNRSVALSSPDDPSGRPVGSLALALTLAVALVMALGLFVLAPHLLSLLMLYLDLGGDVEGVSFHLWDGFYKCAIFMTYIWLISFTPDIRRVFQYHGAEHKTIHAFERCGRVDAGLAGGMSRLHPRCGTTFLLFVICISIVCQALLTPALLALHTPASLMAKHAMTILFKIALVIPISALAYELIRYAAALPDGLWSFLLQAPGLFLQRLTTREPDQGQIEVAVVSLAEALGPEWADTVHPAPYAQAQTA